MPADVRSVQVTGDVGTQRSTRGAAARQEKDGEVAKVAPDLDQSVVPSEADAAAVAVLAQAGEDGMAKVEEMIEKLKAENLTLQGQLIAQKSAQAGALLDKVRLE